MQLDNKACLIQQTVTVMRKAKAVIQHVVVISSIQSHSKV